MGSHDSPEKRQLIIIIFKVMYLGLCWGSLSLHVDFLDVRRAGDPLPHGTPAAAGGGSSCCRAWAPGCGGAAVVARALTSPQHAESSVSPALAGNS